ncbi:hypothetical protein O181_064195 [Austropuccinia psidii MF-1]|uniref:Uncharacterized protein n=1 Tax=Austropuccinia psidii MF-1 TaxID=1389203 RepID=A0A9Q3ESQ5_9BASI|nr:hypothetical protein [Austropuccinia psidii MF-1]
MFFHIDKILALHLGYLGVPRNQQEIPELFKGRRSGSGSHCGWNNTEGNHSHTSIHLPVQQEPQIRGLEGYGLSSSAPPASQRLVPVENARREVKPGITLGINWSKLKEDMSQRDTLQRNYENIQSF